MTGGTSPRDRAAFLDGLGSPAPSGGGGFIEKISEAERAAELTEADLFEAVGVVREAQAQAPDMAEQRDLDPNQRHAYVTLLEAESRWRRCIAADDAARAKRDRLLAGFEEITRPMPGWAGPDDEGGLSPADRSRQY